MKYGPNFQDVVLHCIPFPSTEFKILPYSCCVERGQSGQAAPARAVVLSRKEGQTPGCTSNLPTFNIEEQTNPQVICVKKPEMDKNNSMTNAGKTYKGAEARHSWDSLTARSTRKGWTGKKQGLRFLPSRLRPCPS